MSFFLVLFFIYWFFRSTNDLKTGKFEQKLLDTHIAELHGGLGVFATAFNTKHLAHPKAFMFYHTVFAELDSGLGCGC